MRWTLDTLARSGLGWLGIHAAQALLGRRYRSDRPCGSNRSTSSPIGPTNCGGNAAVSMGCAPSATTKTLQILYPKHDRRFIRLKLSEGTRVLGWAVLLDSPLSDHKHFGNMRLGSIVDNFAAPGDAAAVLRTAAAFLQSQGVDLIVSNQSMRLGVMACVAWAFSADHPTSFLPLPRNLRICSNTKACRMATSISIEETAMDRSTYDGKSILWRYLTA